MTVMSPDLQIVDTPIVTKVASKSDALKKHVGINAFIGTFGTSLFIQACTVVQGILIARVLGPVGRGEYAAVILWPNLFAMISLFGSNIAISRAAARRHEIDSITRSAGLLGLITSFLGAIVCYFAIPWLMPAAEARLINIARMFVLFIPLNHISLNLMAVNQGAGDFGKFNLARAVLNPIYMSGLIALWLLGFANVQWFAIALLAANFAAVIFQIALAFKNNQFFGRFHSPVNLLNQSVHFGLAAVSVPLYAHIDKVILLWLLGAENLGIYVVALTVSDVINSVTNATGMITFTVAAQARHGERFDKVAKAFRMSLLLWIVLGGILAIVIPWVLPMVYGNDFRSAIGIAQLLMIGQAFSGLSRLLEQAMRGQGKAFVGLEGRAAGFVVMAALGVIMAKYYGLPGICTAFIIAQLSCLAVIIHRTNCHYRTSPYAYVPRVTDAKAIFITIQGWKGRLLA